MEKPVSNCPPPTSLNPLKDDVGVSAVDYSAKFDELYKRVNNAQTLLEKKSICRVDKIPRWTSKTTISRSTTRYTTKKSIVDDTYKDLKTTEFTIQLSANQYMNFHSAYLVFPLKIKKS